MASVKIKSPSAVTGNNDMDISTMNSYLRYLANQLNYTLNNLDEENFTTDYTSESTEGEEE